jgi:hypothetical protein
MAKASPRQGMPKEKKEKKKRREDETRQDNESNIGFAVLQKAGTTMEERNVLRTTNIST